MTHNRNLLEDQKVKRSLVFVLVLALVALIGVATPGCVTTRAADGSSTTQVDQASAIAILTVSLTSAQQALDAYLEFKASQGQAADAVEVARRQSTIDAIQATINSLLAKPATTSTAAASGPS